MKTAIICHGGAIKAAFAAGVLYSLSKHGIKAADLVMGTSASVPTTCYFVSRQFSLIKDIWEKELGNKKFIKIGNFLKGEPVFDLDYLINIVFKKRKRLNVGAIKNSKTKFLIPLYNHREHRAEYWSNHNSKVGGGFWDILRASMVIHDKNLVYKDDLERFVDIDLVPFLIYQNKENFRGINRFIIISNHKDLSWNIKKMIGHKFFIHFQTKNFPAGAKEMMEKRKRIIQKGFKIFNEFLSKNNVLFINPLEDSPFHLVNDKNAEIKKDFMSGERVADLTIKNNKNFLEAFIDESKPSRF